jgi:collagen type I/II/III/V/XI/XXIV/XXVII alpha
VGDAGSGSLDVQAGTTVSVASGTLTVGNASGGTGTITLGGSGAEVTADALTIGNMGTGAITVGDSSTLATSGSLTLGLVHGGGNGMITVAGTGDLSVSGNMIVGSGGIGALDVNASSLDISGSLDIADGVASSGDVTLAQSTLSVGTITIGNSGAGTFSANQAAEVTATGIVVGAAKLGNGTFNLDGSGSEVQAGSMQVGNAGTGALQGTNHALLQVTGLATMGVTASAKLQETAAIESNASWTSGSELDIGEKATGIVTVDTGGQVSAPSVIRGDQATASGTVTVTGTGTLPSALDFGTLEVGNLGTGSLALALGAQAGTADTAGTVEIGATAGATGAVTLTDAGTTLQAQVFAVGGGATAAGGSGALSIGAGASVNAGTVTVWGGGTITLAGGDLTTDPMTVDGEVSGYGTIAGAIVNNGIIAAKGGALTLSGSISGSGTLAFGGVATLVLASPGAGITAPVAGLAAGDRIELAGLAVTGAQITSPGTVTVTTSGASYRLSEVSFAAGIMPAFVTGHDPATGDDFIEVACFAAGARLLTVSGEVAVEALAPGDLVVTRSGRRRPVRWIGRRAIDVSRHPRPQDVCPVLVQADAFALGMPHRDLRLSPDHAVFAGGVLIPVRYLINGATIRQEAAADIIYYHGSYSVIC